MKSYEFTRFYHPKLGRFMYKHKGSGIIVDNIFKPIKSVLSTIFKKAAKPLTKRALESGISHAGDKLGKKAAEKSGELIMRKLANMRTDQQQDYCRGQTKNKTNSPGVYRYDFQSFNFKNRPSKKKNYLN